MAGEIPKGLEWTFLIHFFVTAFFGVAFMFFHKVILEAVEWPYYDEVTSRLLGAAMIAIATSSLLAWREKEVEKVRIVMEMELVWLILAVVVSIYGIIMTMNLIVWAALGLFAAFLVGFIYYYREAF